MMMSRLVDCTVRNEQSSESFEVKLFKLWHKINRHLNLEVLIDSYLSILKVSILKHPII